MSLAVLGAIFGFVELRLSGSRQVVAALSPIFGLHSKTDIEDAARILRTGPSVQDIRAYTRAKATQVASKEAEFLAALTSGNIAAAERVLVESKGELAGVIDETYTPGWLNLFGYWYKDRAQVNRYGNQAPEDTVHADFENA